MVAVYNTVNFISLTLLPAGNYTYFQREIHSRLSREHTIKTKHLMFLQQEQIMNISCRIYVHGMLPTVISVTESTDMPRREKVKAFCLS